MDLFLTAAVAGGLLAWRRLPPDSLGIRVAGPVRQLAWGLLGGVAAWLVSWAAGYPLAALEAATGGGVNGADPRGDENMYAWMAPYGLPRVALLFVLTAASQELLYRGLLLPRIRQFCGSWSVAVVACAFLLGNVYAYAGSLVMSQIIVGSIVVGVVFVRSGSLLAAAVANFTISAVDFSVWTTAS